MRYIQLWPFHKLDIGRLDKSHIYLKAFRIAKNTPAGFNMALMGLSVREHYPYAAQSDPAHKHSTRLYDRLAQAD